MTFKQIFKLSAGAVGAMAISMPAQAASFTGFSFDAVVTLDPNNIVTPGIRDSRENIWLDSVIYDGKRISDFSLVEEATVKQTTHSNGPASTDLGDNASNPIASNETPDGSEIQQFLGNLNLNNIVDSEEDAISTIELAFGKKVNTFYLFERGLNSGMSIETFDAQGSTLTSFRIDASNWEYAGYSIDTKEITEAQRVGAYGVRLDSAVSKIRIVSNGVTDNGPDYKIVAAQVPEPSSMAALALLGGGALLAKRRKQAV